MTLNSRIRKLFNLSIIYIYIYIYNMRYSFFLRFNISILFLIINFKINYFINTLLLF